jgi:two-component system OmpR family sensor kinase
MLGHETGVTVLLDPMPTPVLGDALRLRQLVTILVDNAIRHSRAGSTVETRVRPDDGGAVLQVDDHGPGIKPEDLVLIFERFWRADDAPAGGTGLGLAIAKWIVEQHGGKISAANRPDGGARFTVWLPSGANAAADWAADEVVEADWRAPRPPEPPEAPGAPDAPDAPEPQAS